MIRSWIAGAHCVAYFPSSKRKGRPFFIVIVGGYHEIYAGCQRSRIV